MKFINLHNKNFNIRIVRTCGLVVSAIGFVVLFGWLADNPLFTMIGSGIFLMAPSAALLFILFGLALFFHASPTGPRKIMRSVVIIAASLGALAGLIIFILSLLNITLDVERLGFSIIEKANIAAKGHMSPLTALGFVLAGVYFLSLYYFIQVRSWRTTLSFLSSCFILLIAIFDIIAYLVGWQFLLEIGIIPPALITSIAFLALGAGLAADSAQKRRQNGINSGTEGIYYEYPLIFIFILFSFGIVMAGYFYFLKYKDNYRVVVEEQLSAIADQKESEITQWRNDRLGDGMVFYNNTSFSNLVKRLTVSGKDRDVLNRLEIWLERAQTAHNYDSVFLLNSNGKTLMSVPDNNKPAAPHLVMDALEAIQLKKIIFFDFHRHSTDNHIHLAVMVPLYEDEEKSLPLGVLVFRINPETFLYPLIKGWPLSTDTAETLLVRREGNDVVFLNELRFQKDSALNIKFPMDRTELPAVQAVLGKEGIVEGTDYRGKPVIASVRAIYGSPWFIVARIDKAEIFAPLRERMLTLIILVGVLLTGLAIAFILIFRQQVLQSYKKRYEAIDALRESEIRYSNLLENMMEGCQIIGFDWRYKYLNDTAARHGRQSNEDLLGHTIMERYPGIEKTELFESLKECMETRRVKTIENEFVYPDGQKRAFILSIQPVSEGIFILSIDRTDHKRAEEALRHSMVFLNSIIEHSPHAMWISDSTGTLIRMNQACRELLQITDEEVVGKYNVFNDNIVEEQGFMPLVKKVFETGETARFVFKYDSSQLKHVDLSRKRSVILEVTISAVLNTGGRVTNAIIQHVDITEQNRAEERIKHLNAILLAIRGVNRLITRQKDREQLIKESCDVLVSSRGIRSAWIMLMDQLGKLEAYAESGQGDVIFTLKSKFERGEFPRCVGMALESPGVVAIKDTQHECAECPLGSRHEGYGAFCAKLKKEGNLYGVIFISIPSEFVEDPQEYALFEEIADDISFALYNIDSEIKRILMEKELKDSEARYRMIFESAGEGILVTHKPTKMFKYANPAVCKMLGYTEDELKGMKIDNLHRKDMANWVNMEFDRHYYPEKPILHQDIPFLKKDGTILYADVLTTPKILIDGTYYSATFILDVTERKKAEDEKTKLQEHLWQTQKMESIGRLSGGIAHDFNNILTAIIGNAEIALMMLKKEDPLKEIIDSIRDAGENAANLTHQILAFSRKQVFQTEVLNLNDIVNDVKNMLRRLISENIDLEISLAPDPGMVETDRGQMVQVIMNLAVNAKDAMPNGGKLIIETSSVELDAEYAKLHFPTAPGHYEMLSISDTGEGISKEIQEKIFDPFFTTKEIGKGTGLGLSIVYGIVKQSNGYIWVYSEEGKGTAFKIYLPTVYNAEKGLREIKDIKPEIQKGSETVLVVEDNAMIMKIVKKVLDGCGYTVLCATNGHEALRISEEFKGTIHLLFTDVIMPKMGGRELAGRLLEKRPALKVLYMSGYTDNAIFHQGVLEKGLSFIQKPFTPDGLARKIRETLDRQT